MVKGEQGTPYSLGRGSRDKTDNSLHDRVITNLLSTVNLERLRARLHVNQTPCTRTLVSAILGNFGVNSRLRGTW